MENFKKLNKNDKKELRKKIEKLLEEVPEGKRIHLDKDFLEALLFKEADLSFTDDMELPKGFKQKAKFIVWSGKFLSKIDLSEISFNDVMWDTRYYKGDSGIKKDQPNYYEGVKKIDLSNTNARIDFTMSFDAKMIRRLPNVTNWFIDLDHCNFENVVLSNNSIDTSPKFRMHKCNFRNTGIRIKLGQIIEQFDENEEDSYPFVNCDFSGLDLRGNTIDGDYLLECYSDGYYNNFSGTGLRIDFDALSEDEEYKDLYEECYEEYLKKGYFDGCYIDNERIMSKAEKVENIPSLIEEQISYDEDGNITNIEDVREALKELLKLVPNGSKRIHLNKDLLEALLFDKEEVELCDNYDFPDDYYPVAKFPVWSGKFLRKLDLSEVSFEDVSWDVFGDLLEDTYFDVEDRINYNNTNAVIDFSKSFEAKIARQFSDLNLTTCISNCSFKNVDLSNNVIERDQHYELYDCNFSNSGLKIDFDALNKRIKEQGDEYDTQPDYRDFAYDCDFSGLDFSEYTIDGSLLVHQYNEDGTNDYYGTGLNIIFSNEDLESDAFKVHVRDELIRGCTINGRKYLTKEDAKKTMPELREEYARFKDELFTSVQNNIEYAIKSLK
jgi:uncharacterized protein YjbI with pentapeptide repeats